MYSYAFYLLGRTRFGVPNRTLDKLIGRWFYAITLSGRYTGSPETIMDGDMNLIKDIRTGDQFVGVLSRIVTDTLTNDFWAITLPNDLETSAT